MCIIFIAFQTHPQYPLIILANRDEFYQRPTEQAHFWPDHPDLLAGKDLQSHGTWLGITKSGRFAAITNYRSAGEKRKDAVSRGRLVKDFLCGTETPLNYCEAVQKGYNGYNLLVTDRDELVYLSNHAPHPEKLQAGVYGLSNGLLHSAWPKVKKGEAFLEEICRADTFPPVDELLNFMRDSTTFPDRHLPDTGFGLDLERKLSSIFIAMEEYGTRSSTLLWIDNHNQVTFIEHTYEPPVPGKSRKQFRFKI